MSMSIELDRASPGVISHTAVMMPNLGANGRGTDDRIDAVGLFGDGDFDSREQGLQFGLILFRRSHGVHKDLPHT